MQSALQSRQTGRITPVLGNFTVPAICFAAAVLLLFLPLRTGDLAGYDDAQYADMAKGIIRSGDWFHLRTNGLIAVEHPPLHVWMQAALFEAFGANDAMARLPAAICGLGTLFFVYLLGRSLLNDLAAALALFVLLTSAYFLKYAARGMTDVSFAFLFTVAEYCWVRGQDDRRWILLAGVATGLALMTRDLMGLALVGIFFLDLVATRRRIPVRLAAGFLLLAFVPVTAWYGYQTALGSDFLSQSSIPFLRNGVYGPMTPSWRRFTGAPEYLWMLAKSYWPWLPLATVGMVQIARRRDRRLWILLIWPATVFVLCSASKSRVLRYMLPAYPAFALWTAIGLQSLLQERYLRRFLPVAAGLVALLYAYLAVFPKTHWEAAATRPMALELIAAAPAHERIPFYDGGAPRFDEINQLHWYGDRDLALFTDESAFLREVTSGRSTALAVDGATYRNRIQPKNLPIRVIYESGHLVCLSRTHPR